MATRLTIWILGAASCGGCAGSEGLNRSLPRDPVFLSLAASPERPGWQSAAGLLILGIAWWVSRRGFEERRRRARAGSALERALAASAAPVIVFRDARDAARSVKRDRLGWARVLFGRRGWLDESLERGLSPLGPVFSIGSVPEPAARELGRRARAVVCVFGSAAWVGEVFGRLVADGAAGRLVVVVADVATAPAAWEAVSAHASLKSVPSEAGVGLVAGAASVEFTCVSEPTLGSAWEQAMGGLRSRLLVPADVVARAVEVPERDSDPVVSPVTRVFATLADGSLGIVVCVGVLWGIDRTWPELGGWELFLVLVFSGTTWLFLGVGLLCSPWRGTIGHRLFGLRVASTEGARLGPGSALSRVFLKAVTSWSFPMIFVREDGLALHDLAVGSRCTTESAAAPRALEVGAPLHVVGDTPAPLRLRLLAASVDWALIVAGHGAARFALERGEFNSLARDLGPLWVGVTVAYFVGCEAAPAQATLGKRLFGLRVTDVSGGRLGVAHALGRTVAKLFLGWMLLVHDRLARTRVRIG